MLHPNIYIYQEKKKKKEKNSHVLYHPEIIAQLNVNEYIFIYLYCLWLKWLKKNLQIHRMGQVGWAHEPLQKHIKACKALGFDFVLNFMEWINPQQELSDPLR